MHREQAKEDKGDTHNTTKPFQRECVIDIGNENAPLVSGAYNHDIAIL